MGAAYVGAAQVCEQALVFDYRGGLFYVTDPTLGITQAMRPTEFFSTIAAAVECSRQHRPWAKPSAEIIDLHHAATGKSSK